MASGSPDASAKGSADSAKVGRRPSFWTEARRAYRKMRGGRLTPERFGGSVALGLFVGTLPLYGVHFPLCAGLGLWLGLDVLVAYVAAHISIPPTAPLLVYASTELGALALTGSFADIDFSTFDAEQARVLAASLLLGSVLLGLALALVGGGAAFLAAWAEQKVRHQNERKNPESAAEESVDERNRREERLDLAIDRVTARYEGAPRAHRHYVTFKLRLDPLGAQLEKALAERVLGRVVDLGCGRGQFGLLLSELARVDSLVGVDLDASKVEVARAAARGQDATFHAGPVEGFEVPPADTILLLDVLHYLPPEARRSVLERARQSLAPGGRLLVRETNTDGLGARLARLLERVGARLGVNRAEQLSFSPIEEAEAELGRLGLRLESREARGALDNVLLVARA